MADYTDFMDFTLLGILAFLGRSRLLVLWVLLGYLGDGLSHDDSCHKGYIMARAYGKRLESGAETHRREGILVQDTTSTPICATIGTKTRPPAYERDHPVPQANPLCDIMA